jgi:ligand-binding sensor domain-containing protein/signal transduction histidine kinase
MKTRDVKIKSALAFIAFGTLNALICPAVLALDPALDLSQYAHRAWSYRDGFLNGAVYAFAQTPDGYLWLGTQSGLVRFDGVRAVPFALPHGQQLPSTAVWNLLAARDGSLWIGTLDGLACLQKGSLTDYPALAGYSVNAILEDRDGTVWAGAFGSEKGKLCAIRGTRTTCYGDDGSFGGAVTSLYEDKDGGLWVGAATGMWRWKPGPPKRCLSEAVPSRQAFAAGDHGSDILAAVFNVRQIVGNYVTNYPLDGAPSPLTASSLLRDRNGGLWIGTRAHGLVHSYQGTTSLLSHNDGLSSDQVEAIFEDREGTIWVATADGLDRFRDSPVRSLPERSGLSSTSATSVLAARDGSVWIGTADGLDRWKDGQITIYRRRSDPSLPDDLIQSMSEDETGRIWVSGDHGLAVFDHGRFTAVPGVPAGNKNSIIDDGHGGLWLSLWLTPKGEGLVHLTGGRIVEQVSWQTVGGGPGSGLVSDSAGGVWTGLLTGGIADFRAGQVRHLALTKDAAREGRVLDLSRDRDGAMWAATEDGLARIANDSVATLTTANGLPCNSVHWMIEDDSSSYWLYTRCGLVRIPRNEIQAWISDPKRAVQLTTFDSADGVRLVAIASGSRPAATKASDGRIWFVNANTVSVIDPSHIGMNTLPPPVHIEQITGDGQTYDARPGVRLPARVRDLAIDYTALSLAAPEKVHFRFKLEGQDPDWREVVNDRQVQYSNLPPGSYRFRVTASNNSGVWNETGDTLEFSIAPAYYQTSWFRASVLMTLLLMLWGMYRLRLHQLAREFNAHLEGRVDERLRVSRDLHDTLLQTFQGLIPVFQTARNLLPLRADRAAEVLDEGLKDAADAIVEGRNAIQNLRGKPSLDRDIGSLLNAAGQELADSTKAEGSPPEFRVVIEGSQQPLAPLLQDEVYRIAREMLRNAFRHAHANRIEAEIRYDRGTFRLRIRDNGKGIDSTVLKKGARTGHFGLPGMHERAKRIGGRLKIWSEPGAGTEAELMVPARIAYKMSPPAKLHGASPRDDSNAAPNGEA